MGLQVAAAATIEAVEATVTYPSDRLTAMSVSKTTFSQNMTIAANLKNAGEIRIAMAGVDALSGDGELLQFTFQAGAASDQPCVIELAEIVVNDVAQTCIDNGSITIGTGGPDLVIKSIAGPKSVYLGQALALTSQVTNKGDVNAPGFKIGLYLSTNVAIDPSSDLLLLKAGVSAGLNAGQKKQISPSVAVPIDLAPGSYYIGAVADIDRQVAETSETNNKKTSSRKVQILRYQDNNDTVTDHLTGLMWQAADDGQARTWSEAKSYCNGLKLGGYEDWELPTVHDLFSLVEVTRFNPAIEPVFDSRSSEYWSATSVAFQADQAWSVNFEGGLPHWSDKAYPVGYVRCVRR